MGASAAILGKRADGMLLVVRPGIANYQSANYVNTMLEQSPQRRLGLVVNGVISTYQLYGQYLSEEFFDETSPDATGTGNDLDIEITSPGREGRP